MRRPERRALLQRVKQLKAVFRRRDPLGLITAANEDEYDDLALTCASQLQRSPDSTPWQASWPWNLPGTGESGRGRQARCAISHAKWSTCGPGRSKGILMLEFCAGRGVARGSVEALCMVYFHLVIRHDPFVNVTGGASYEPALGYWAVALVLLSLGAGRFSLDSLLFARPD